MGSGVDAQVEPGFSKASQYDSHRATYSADAIEILLENLQVSGKKHARILDLAAGTGKCTDALAARDEQFDIVTVEPLESMRKVLEDRKLANVEVKSGHASSIPLKEASVDAVVVAQLGPALEEGALDHTFLKTAIGAKEECKLKSLQAFHWFANLDALREIHRVLHPHGALGMVWNIEHWNQSRDLEAATSWERKANDLLWSLKSKKDASRYRDLKWRKVFDEQVKKTPLSLLIADDDQLFALPLAEQKLEWEIKLSKEGAWDRFSTLSQVAVLEGEERERVRKLFMDAINEADADSEGQVTVHGYTHLVWTTKIPGEGRPSLTDVETPPAD